MHSKLVLNGSMVPQTVVNKSLTTECGMIRVLGNGQSLKMKWLKQATLLLVLLKEQLILLELMREIQLDGQHIQMKLVF